MSHSHVTDKMYIAWQQMNGKLITTYFVYTIVVFFPQGTKASLASKTLPAKSKGTQLITNDKRKAAHWIEHFKETLNRPEPTVACDNLATLPPDYRNLHTSMELFSKVEIKRAVRHLKNGRHQTTRIF